MWYLQTGLLSGIQSSWWKLFYSLQRGQEVQCPLFHPSSRKIFFINGVSLSITEWYFSEVMPRVPSCGRLWRTTPAKGPRLERSEFRLSQGTTIGGKWVAAEQQQQWHTSFGLVGVTSPPSRSCSVYCLGQSPIHADQIPIFQRKDDTTWSCHEFSAMLMTTASYTPSFPH